MALPAGITLVGTPTPLQCVFLVVGDGTATAVPISNADILASMVAGALKDLWNATYADQAAMRLALLVNGATVHTQLRTPVNDVTAEHNQPAVDVDVDAVTATKAELNTFSSDTTGQAYYVRLTCIHTAVR